ncbi:MAG: fructosamine kinase family protein, partial [Verrucomicrobiales bacterium]
MNSTDSQIASALGSRLVSATRIGGGCIHNARRFSLADGRSVFVKSAAGPHAALLTAEARALALLAPHTRVPTLVGDGETPAATRWIALEWLDLHPLTTRSWHHLGRQLAALHTTTSPTHGLDHHNFIGSTPQSNTPTPSWAAFFRDQRLRPQLRLARHNGHLLPETDILASSDHLLANHHPAPALLHGDLWSGNTAALADDTSVIFDPAPYFGDPETDLAMLELFGGPLPAPFHSGYG